MFKDEIISKFDADDLISSYSVSVFGGRYVACLGIKTIVMLTNEQIKLKTKKQLIAVSGSDLILKEIGGGEVYITGSITAVELL